MRLAIDVFCQVYAKRLFVARIVVGGVALEFDTGVVIRFAVDHDVGLHIDVECIVLLEAVPKARLVKLKADVMDFPLSKKIISGILSIGREGAENEQA